MDRANETFIVVTIVGGQPGLGRYLAFGTLFAHGPDAAIDRIDRHRVMSRHAVTPMGEADLRRRLPMHGLSGLRFFAPHELRDTTDAIIELQDGPVMFDAVTEEDLRRIATILRAPGGQQLLIGASSKAEVVAGAGRV